MMTVLPSQAANPYVSERVVEWQEAYKHADVLSIAPYISCNIPREGKKLNSALVEKWTLDEAMDYMENVAQIVEEPEGKNNSIISWDCMVDDVEFSWKQRNTYDEGNHLIAFELIEGDFDVLEGAWQVLEDSGKVHLRLNIRYSIGLPVIEDVLGPILKEKLEENSISMLNSIKNRLEGV